MTIMRSLLALTVLALTMICPGCSKKDSPWTDLHRNAKECVTVIFTHDATERQVAAALHAATTVPSAPGRRGTPLNPAINSVVNTLVNGRVAYEICFVPTASRAEIRKVEATFRASGVTAEITEGRSLGTKSAN